MNQITPITFTPVEEITEPLPLAIGISGGSGTGKTYSALRIARGIAHTMGGPDARIGFVDTENRRALHYRESFPEMAHFDMKAVDSRGNMIGFGPERWIEIIDAAEQAGLGALVIDSFSHAWEGIGGVLDMQALELDRLVEDAEKRAGGRYPVDPAKYAQLAWAAVKPRYRRLTDRIVRAALPIVICTRAKPVMQQGFGDKQKNARKTKTRREDVPWDPASDGDLMFDMTAMVILDPSAPGCPVYQIKCADQFKSLFDPRRPMDENLGAKMAEWAMNQGDGTREKQLLDQAREAARGGRASLQRFWNGLGKGSREREVVKRILETELVPIANEAEAANASDDEIPFGDKAPNPTEAEREAAIAEAARRAREEAAKYEQ